MDSTETKYTLSQIFSDEQLRFIAVAKNAGLTWDDAAVEFNTAFGSTKTANAIRHAFRRYGDSILKGAPFDVKKFKDLASEKAKNSKVTKENKILLKYLNANEEILEQIAEAIKNIAVEKVILPKAKKRSTKKKMTLELMLSDLHIGKKTKTFNHEICKKRLRILTETILGEIERASDVYNVERLIIALLGDLIESYTMHGIESSHACEFGNSKQIQVAIETLYLDVLYPLAMTGLKIDVPCVTGNHDRTEKERTMVNPGEANVTWIIYNTLQMLCKQAGFKNMTFYIPEGPYITLDIYGNTALYEHGDNVRSTVKTTLEKLINRRASQIGRLVDFFRMGHFHEYVMYDRGKIIVNESVPGPDSYSDVLGFNSYAGQTLNFYIETKKRPTCFYRSFPIYLP